MTALKLPKQASPVGRNATAAKVGRGIAPSGQCELLCNKLSEPARTICKESCRSKAALAVGLPGGVPSAEYNNNRLPGGG